MSEDEAAAEQQRANALEHYVSGLLDDRASEIPSDLAREDLAAYMLAAELVGTQYASDHPSPDVIARLRDRLDEVLANQGPMGRSSGRGGAPSRRQVLTAAAGVAAGLLVGVVLDHSVPELGKPEVSLVGPNGRWYDVAAAQEVPAGAVRKFSAGGVDGYLVNQSGAIRAVSAICTHMGCHIDWRETHDRFECLCHGAAFSRQGGVLAGVPPAPLPRIHTRVHNGRIYAWGTQDRSWG